MVALLQLNIILVSETTADGNAFLSAVRFSSLLPSPPELRARTLELEALSGSDAPSGGREWVRSDPPPLEACA